MDEGVKPCMDEAAGGCKYVFQQDKAPAQNSKRTQDWFPDNISEFWEEEFWSPSRPAEMGIVT